jgi:hypothetical protein
MKRYISSAIFNRQGIFMKFYKSFNLIFALIIFGLTGCVALLDPPINYDVDDIEESANRQLKDVVLDIQPFEDARKSVPEYAILFSESYDDFYLKIGEVEYCINREDKYIANKGDVPLQVSTIIAKHLDKRGAFKSVLANNKENQPVVYEEESQDTYGESTDEIKHEIEKKKEKIPADYYVTGKLVKFYGQQEYIQGAKSAALVFGVIGQLATMGVDTPLFVEIEIVDLAVYKNDGQLLAKIGNIHEKFSEEATGGRHCNGIYDHVNKKLKYTIEKLADRIETTMINSLPH